MKVLITGGTGLIGKQLRKHLENRGMEVAILSRRPTDKNKSIFNWDIQNQKIDPQAFDGIDGIVHLAGASVAGGRWTASRKKLIMDSRVDSADLILKSLKARKQKISFFVSASGIGIYGIRPGEKLTDSSSPGTGFLTDVCLAWEASAHQFSDLAERIYILRTPIVLANGGGFLGKLKPLVKNYLGSKLGKGNQMTSWIHLQDIVQIYAYAIEHKLKPGTYNACSPNPVSHSKMMDAMAKSLHARIWLPNLPAFFIKLVFGEFSSELLAWQEAYPKSLLNEGFQFKHPTVESAFEQLAQDF
jgi:uncharacterized protein (TIGR01777 family)